MGMDLDAVPDQKPFERLVAASVYCSFPSRYSYRSCTPDHWLLWHGINNRVPAGEAFGIWTLIWHTFRRVFCVQGLTAAEQKRTLWVRSGVHPTAHLDTLGQRHFPSCLSRRDYALRQLSGRSRNTPIRIGGCSICHRLWGHFDNLYQRPIRSGHRGPISDHRAGAGRR